MPIIQVELENFRCLTKARLEFDAHQNLILGANAAGKTSILEAIYYLAAGRSFKSASAELLIQNGESRFLLFGRIEDAGGIPTSLGILGSKSGNELRMDGKSLQSISEF